MQIVWNDKSIRWFKNASDYTGYNKKLAKLLLEYLKPGGTLCDVGCGAGLVDLELARHCREITCVDISQAAVSAVAGAAQREGLDNISAVCLDGGELEGRWDTVMALFHGGNACFEKYFRLASDCLILATHASRLGEFGPEERKVQKCFNAQQLTEYLDEKGIQYALHDVSLEYGQPVCDRLEAADFIRSYTLPMTEEEMEKYLAENLRETGREDFPYYFPKKKAFGLFIIRRHGNEKL